MARTSITNALVIAIVLIAPALQATETNGEPTTNSITGIADTPSETASANDRIALTYRLEETIENVEEILRTTRNVDKAVKDVDQHKLRFVGFAEGVLRVRIPQWWINTFVDASNEQALEPLLGAVDTRVYSNPALWRGRSVGSLTDAGYKMAATDVWFHDSVDTDFPAILPLITGREPGLNKFPMISHAVEELRERGDQEIAISTSSLFNDRVAVAIHSATHTYQVKIVLVDLGTMKEKWSARLSTSGPGGFTGGQRVELCDGGNSLIVAGQCPYNLYLARLDIATGKVEFVLKCRPLTSMGF